MRQLMFSSLRRTLVIFGILVALLASTFAIVFNASAASQPKTVTLAGSSRVPSGAFVVGQHDGDLTIDLVLRSPHESEMNALLSALYDPKSPQYHHWLQTGEFLQRFGPTSQQVLQVQNFLKQAGLQVTASSSPFLVQATGSTAKIQAAFHTHIRNYRAHNGQSFFQNDSAVQIPSSLNGTVSGVMGLTDSVREHAHYIATPQAAKAAGKTTPKYGAGPGGSGLTPSQTDSIYSADQVHNQGAAGQGSRVTLAVFELSGYTPADIKAFEKQFFGSSVNVPLVDVNVDGGPIHPQCPAGDFGECGPFGDAPCETGCNSADYSGDIEVEADIEQQIAMDPKAKSVIVYNAPNDNFGITTVDEYNRIAQDNRADSISTSWGLCEQDIPLGTIVAESYAFTQMAAQGQSIFDASGDSGAYDCLLGSGSTDLAVEDPSTQPFVTSVGGTSMGTFDPGKNQHPAYPTGQETVWNPFGLCTPSGDSLDGGCFDTGAGGGGVSKVWGKPNYQQGAGVISQFSKKASTCTLSFNVKYCREVPDVSANADQYTPYAELCTGAKTVSGAGESTCGLFASDQPAPGWFGIGGTSLSAPVWAGIIGLWDSVHGKRIGSTNAALYQFFNASNTYTRFFHDITGKNQQPNTNGFYPTTVNYDLATGIGSPRISNIAQSNP